MLGIAGKPKVKYRDSRGVDAKDVVWLDVSMNNGSEVDAMNGAKDSANDIKCHRNWHAPWMPIAHDRQWLP